MKLIQEYSDNWKKTNAIRLKLLDYFSYDGDPILASNMKDASLFYWMQGIIKEDKENNDLNKWIIISETKDKFEEKQPYQIKKIWNGKRFNLVHIAFIHGKQMHDHFIVVKHDHEIKYEYKVDPMKFEEAKKKYDEQKKMNDFEKSQEYKKIEKLHKKGV